LRTSFAKLRQTTKPQLQRSPFAVLRSQLRTTPKEKKPAQQVSGPKTAPLAKQAITIQFIH
ncbi:hypothetical protein, partial [Paenibacillus gorillae]|uniref:hypothetical protein n=1 Tax=Paenibacillus gorillae TaxID=1243662 RepID=UPI0005A6A1FB